MKQMTSRTSQAGVMLIEALIAILIFSVGVLGIIGLQASAAKASSDAQFRSEAALLANELIGRMWAGDRTQATLQANYNSATNGVLYQQWAWVGTNAGAPGTQAAPAPSTVLRTLPGAIANPPTVVVTSSAGTVIPSSQVTVTIFWQVPGEAAVHNYVAMAQVGG
jgi:type IV pilus assembly protein PilV